MALIQIEQDNPQVIERARLQIAQMVEAQALFPDDAKHCNAYSLRVNGYLAALLVENLISKGQFLELLGEVEAVDRMAALSQADNCNRS